jgi:hypothetical protein
VSKKSDSDFYWDKKTPRIGCPTRGDKTFKGLGRENYWAVPVWQSTSVVVVVPEDPSLDCGVELI